MPKDGEPAVEESAVEEHIADLAAKDDVPEARAAGVDQSETPIAGDEALAVEEPMDAAPNAEPDAEVKADESVLILKTLQKHMEMSMEMLMKRKSMASWK